MALEIFEQKPSTTEIDAVIDDEAIVALHAVPTADVSTNANVRDVVGNKTDAAVAAVTTTKSLMAYIKALVNSNARQLNVVTFWSDPYLGLTIPATPGTLTMPSVVVAGIPTGATITHVKCLVMCRVIDNLAAVANKLNGATVAATSQVIQVKLASGAWADAITFLDDQISMAALTREGGTVFVSSNNMSATVTGNGTVSFQWLLAAADSASIYLQGVHTIVQVTYSI